MKRACFIRQSDVYPEGELSVRREVETLAQAGYEAHIICLNAQNGPLRPAEEVLHGVHVHRIPIIRRKTGRGRYLYEYLSFFLRASLKVTLLHLRHPFDVIQVNTMPDFLVFAGMIPKMFRAKVVLMMHEPVPELWETLYQSRPPRILRMAEQAALRFADQVFTVTQQLKEAYVSRGASPEKISVILNVPDERFLTSGQAPLPALPKKGHFTLICHGAIEKRYGHDTILAAVAMVKKQFPAIRHLILGRGSYVGEMERRIEELGLKEQVQVLGWVPLSTMLEKLNTADAGIVAQEESPYSNLVHTNKMYEYIALGKPVLATRLRSVRAYFGDEAISFFEPGNPQSLAGAILELIRNPKKRQSLVENAKKTYEPYRWERQKNTYLDGYDQLLAPSRPPAMPDPAEGKWSRT